MDDQSARRFLKKWIVASITNTHAFILRRIWNFVGLYYGLRIRKYPRLLALYQKYESRSKSTGVNVWDAVILYEKVRETRPDYILELGTGASTAYMALALKENTEQGGTQKGLLVSVEDNEEYFQHQRQVFPKCLTGHVEFLLSPLGISQLEQQAAYHYEKIPSYPYELIWVDGPALNENIRVSKDVVNVLPKCAKDVVVFFDGRTHTAKMCAKALGDNYVLRTYPAIHMSIIRKRT